MTAMGNTADLALFALAAEPGVTLYHDKATGGLRAEDRHGAFTATEVLPDGWCAVGVLDA